MLQYLVTSKVRRRLLSLLWADDVRGSVAELAERAGVAFASVHAELKAMQAAQLVAVRHEAGRDVYFANANHPQADALRALVVADARRASLPSAPEDDALKAKLVSLGAPLRGFKAAAVREPDLHSTLVEGAVLARKDGTVARSLPLCFWKRRDSLDAKQLAELVVRPEDKHALGFFLELTGVLGGDRRLFGLAEPFRDRRMTSVRDFFQLGRREVARDFPLAAKWGFAMNMDMDSFRSLFDKYVKK
jgi:hypothetical protein